MLTRLHAYTPTPPRSMLSAIVSSEDRAADQASIRDNKLNLVERLADDLAHEIKNPLHSMVINLEVLRRRIARLDPETNADLLRYAGVLGAELDRVARRVDLLLRMIRPNPDCDEPATFDEVLEELRELVEIECERHHVSFRMEIPEIIDRTRVPRASTRQMILSLMLKTLDSLPPGGTLHVSSESTPTTLWIHFQGTDAEGRVVAPDPSLEDGSYLSVAGTLANRLGGRLHLVDGVVPALSAIRATPPHYLLSLPRAP